MFTNECHQMLCPPKPFPIGTTWKPAVEIAPNCPRCASTNTKFCYYNNYSLSQPRYFCKACRRYWTKGGSLRNVPVGGGCRKSRRAKSSRHDQNRSSSSLSSSTSSSDSLASELPTKEIDLAAVFANFLNHNTSVAQQDFDGQELSNSRNQENVHDDLINNTQCLNPCDNNFVVESELFSGIEGHEMNEFELQSLLGDEAMSQQDVVWCDNETLPGFLGSSWQQQELGVCPNEVEVSANNVINDNWDPLDLSSFEVFSRSNFKQLF